ncbi:MAG TPA: NUDIX domain-containing protein [Salinivirgaceae bacterium]|nr:NUDIX domain-containing protein [Salinivirgaceae bacterium]HRS67608.1 NUDIX domain-containing protein [Paludibacteraceae bacterium]
MGKTHPLNLFKYCPRCGSERFIEYDSKSKKCRQCGFQYYNNSSASVAGFILSDNGKELLLCTRAKNPYKGTLDLTGGFIDNEETAEEAILREIKEELNLDVTKATFLFSLPNIYLYSDFDVHTLDLFFLVEIANIDKLKCSDDVSAAQFIPFKDIDINTIGLSSIKKAVSKFLMEHV